MLANTIQPINQEREHLSFEEWTDIKRVVEFWAFQLAMHILVSPFAWEIRESRWSGAQEDWNAYRLRLRRLYSVYHYYVSHHKGLPRTVYADLTARKLGLSVRQVYAMLDEAKLFGIPDLIASAG